MKKAFIFHGTGADRDSHWFPWLHKELEKKGFKVSRPDFPTPENQEIENWLKILDQQDMEIDEDTVLIGHSLGGVFILNIMNRRDLNAKAAYLVSTWTGLLSDDDFDELNSSFQDQEFDFQEIKNSVKEIHQFHSENDPYVPLEKARELSENIDSIFHLKKDAGHFNTDSDLEKFPMILNRIEKDI